MPNKSVSSVMASVAVAIAFCMPGLAVTVRLSADDTIPVPAIGQTAFMMPMHCDSSGNIYVRTMRNASRSSAPVMEIGTNGDLIRTFHFDQISNGDLRGGVGARFVDYAALGDGALVVLATGPKGAAYVVTFGSDAVYRTTVALQDSGFRPYHVAVFPNGNYLIAGARQDPATSAPSGIPYTAIFSPDGKLIRALTLRGDVHSARTMAEFHPSPGDEGPIAPFTLGTAVTGDDGIVYLLRHLPLAALVFAIGEDGSVVRRLALASSTAGYEPTSGLSVSNGKLILPFFRTGGDGAATIYSGFDARTGIRVFDGEGDASIGAYACDTQDTLAFLSARNNGSVLVHSRVPR